MKIDGDAFLFGVLAIVLDFLWCLLVYIELVFECSCR